MKSLSSIFFVLAGLVNTLHSQEMYSPEGLVSQIEFFKSGGNFDNKYFFDSHIPDTLMEKVFAFHNAGYYVPDDCFIKLMTYGDDSPRKNIIRKLLQTKGISTMVHLFAVGELILMETSNFVEMKKSPISLGQPLDSLSLMANTVSDSLMKIVRRVRTGKGDEELLKGNKYVAALFYESFTKFSETRNYAQYQWNRVQDSILFIKNLNTRKHSKKMMENFFPYEWKHNPQYQEVLKFHGIPKNYLDIKIEKSDRFEEFYVNTDNEMEWLRKCGCYEDMEELKANSDAYKWAYLNIHKDDDYWHD
jgi:hypothetical protein